VEIEFIFTWIIPVKRSRNVSCTMNYILQLCGYNFDSLCLSYYFQGPSYSRSYGSWIYNYLCNRCLSPLMLWVRILTLCDKVCQWLVAGQWIFPGTPISSTNKTGCHDITEILLKVALNTINQTNYYFHPHRIILIL
jgi:hypothetical protein